MDFSSLEYIVFEGGGGKGAVYKGAIVALEKLFDKSWRKGACSKIVDGELAGPEPAAGMHPPREEGGGAGTSILDYYVEQGKLKIKGIAGASAGAITAFPLVLGLTSDDVETILTSFSFQEELLPNHKLNEGKYRMVGMDEDGRALLLVAEDRLRKLGEDNVTAYQVQLFGDKDAVGSNGLKSAIRSAVVSSAFSVIFTGLTEKWAMVRGLAHNIGNFLERLNILKKASAALKGNIVQDLGTQVFGNKDIVRLLTSATSVPLNAGLKWLLKLGWLDINRLPWGSKNQMKIKGLLPADNVVSAVANILWDRGIYAGFEVRELFFKILLLAISKDTHFSRRLQERARFLESMGLSRKEIQDFAVTLNKRFEVELPTDPKVKGTLEKLKRLQETLTFKELYDTTDVNLTICVTNSTTSQPLYFSHYFTPDFPVLEAIGASMTFPLAFKPVYNEANVLLSQGAGRGGGETGARSFLHPSDFVKFRPHRAQGARLFKESFSMREYGKHLAIVLAYVKATSRLTFSVNANLSFRSFLPYLREIIHNERFTPFEVKVPGRDAYQTFDAGYMKSLCYFYYNSAFKGMLFDGGATNNLPAAIFTIQTDPDDSTTIQDLNIKQATLSLKLDNSFPEAIRNEAFDLLEKNPQALERVSAWDDRNAHRRFAERIFARRLRKALKERQQLSSLSGPVWVKISRELVAEYKRTLGGFTPWNRDMNIVAGLLSALQFGFDQGQIENIADNTNIVPLYCYGVDTFDFELATDDVWPLVEMAIEESEKSVLAYFGQ